MMWPHVSRITSYRHKPIESESSKVRVVAESTPDWVTENVKSLWVIGLQARIKLQ